MNKENVGVKDVPNGWLHVNEGNVTDGLHQLGK